MMAMAAIKPTLYLIIHLNRVIGQYNMSISPASDPEIIQEQSNRTLMMAANIYHIAWATDILPHEEMIKDELSDEILRAFIQPYFEKFYMNVDPLKP